jgi:Spy/CpxP family protein refolding chaperone
MKKRIAAVAAVLALSTTLAFAGPGGEGRGRHGRHGKGDFVAKYGAQLNLTEDQKRLIADIKKNARVQMKELFEKSRETMKEARAARQANDTAKLEALKPALQANRAAMKELRKSEETQIMSVLNADQKAAYEKLKEEHRSNRGRKGGRRNG